MKHLLKYMKTEAVIVAGAVAVVVCFFLYYWMRDGKDIITWKCPSTCKTEVCIYQVTWIITDSSLFFVFMYTYTVHFLCVSVTSEQLPCSLVNLFCLSAFDCKLHCCYWPKPHMAFYCPCKRYGNSNLRLPAEATESNTPTVSSTETKPEQLFSFIYLYVWCTSPGRKWSGQESVLVSILQSCDFLSCASQAMGSHNRRLQSEVADTTEVGSL